MGSTESAGGSYNRGFHIHPKLGLYARDCLLAVRVRREETGPWSETHIALDPLAPEMVHELFAALIGHIPNASMGMRFSVIARLLLNGRDPNAGFGGPASDTEDFKISTFSHNGRTVNLPSYYHERYLVVHAYRSRIK